MCVCPRASLYLFVSNLFADVCPHRPSHVFRALIFFFSLGDALSLSPITPSGATRGLYINLNTLSLFIRPWAAVHYDNSDVAHLEAPSLFLVREDTGGDKAAREESTETHVSSPADTHTHTLAHSLTHSGSHELRRGDILRGRTELKAIISSPVWLSCT